MTNIIDLATYRERAHDLRTRRDLRHLFALRSLDNELARVEAELDTAWGNLVSPTCRHKAYWLELSDRLDDERARLVGHRNRLLGLAVVRSVDG